MQNIFLTGFSERYRSANHSTGQFPSAEDPYNMKSHEEPCWFDSVPTSVSSAAAVGFPHDRAEPSMHRSAPGFFSDLEQQFPPHWTVSRLFDPQQNPKW